MPFSSASARWGGAWFDNADVVLKGLVPDRQEFACGESSHRAFLGRNRGFLPSLCADREGRTLGSVRRDETGLTLESSRQQVANFFPWGL